MRTATATPVAVKIDFNMKARIQNLATAQHRTAHWLMKEAIREYVERGEQREAFHQSALKAWQGYQETGLHVTGDEVIDWLDSWGSENEKAAPLCHK